MSDDIRLEPQVAAHAVELYPLLADQALYDFTNDEPPENEETLAKRFASLESRWSPDRSQEWLNWVIRCRDGAAVGYVQATVHADHVAEIAFVLGHRFWGHGLAFSASKAMLSELAARHGVTRVRASVDPRNARSLRLLARLGLSIVQQAQQGELTLEADLALSAESAP